MTEFYLENVKVKYRYGATACAALNFSLKNGDKLAIVGDRGSGKTTLLKLLAGLVNKESGEFLIDDKNADDISVKDRDAVFIEDRPWLFNFRSVEYNLTHSLRIRGERGEELRKKAVKAAETVGLSVNLKKKTFRLSKEEKIKLCYARLFMRSAGVYLIDDLNKELEEESKNSLFETVLEWSRDGNKTVVLATEHLDEALRFSDRILLLSYGVQTAEGLISDLKENIPSVWAFKTVFPEKKLSIGRITQENKRIYLTVAENRFSLDKRLLLDEVFINKDVIAAVSENKIFVFDVVSERLIYPIKL